jgi:hypothetical protein
MVISEDFFGDNSNPSRIGTSNYECLKCKKNCNVYYKERVVVNRNIGTKIHRDKRKKITEKLTKEEIEFYRKNEDF